jgi:hypothetical protein
MMRTKELVNMGKEVEWGDSMHHLPPISVTTVTQPEQLVSTTFTIQPQVLARQGMYVINQEMTMQELDNLRGAWQEMNKQAGTHLGLLVIPHTAPLELLSTAQLIALRDSADKALRAEQGEEV